MIQIRIWLLALLMLITLAGCATPKPSTNNTAPVSNFPAAKIEGLAKALTTAGAKMYGSEFCSACKYQQQMFDEAWKFITYANCDVSANSGVQNTACRAENIALYPTWQFADDSRLQGVQKFEVLAKKIGFDF